MHIKTVISTLLLFFLSLSLHADANKSIATVNGKVITKSMLDRQVATLMPKTYFHANTSEEKIQSLEKKALGQVIDAVLYTQYALKKGYAPTKEETEKLYLDVTKNISPEQLSASFRASNLTEESFKEELAERLAVQTLFVKEIKQTFTEEELNSYYEENKHKFVVPEKARVRVIYIQTNPTDSNGSVKAKKLADELHLKLMNGADFAELATKHSDAMSRINGGDMGFMHDGMLSEDINDEAFKLKKGELSSVIERVMGCYIVKMEDIEPPKQLTYEDVKEKIEKERKASIEKARLEELLIKLKKDAVIVTNE